jgi:hypothetical protein
MLVMPAIKPLAGELNQSLGVLEHAVGAEEPNSSIADTKQCDDALLVTDGVAFLRESDTVEKSSEWLFTTRRPNFLNIFSSKNRSQLSRISNCGWCDLQTRDANGSIFPIQSRDWNHDGMNESLTRSMVVWSFLPRMRNWKCPSVTGASPILARGEPVMRPE